MKDKFEQELFEMAAEEKIVVPETLCTRINDTLVSLPEQKKVFRMTWKKSVILAAALVMMFSITVSAAVGALRQRMEAMNEQEMEEYFVQIYTNKIGSDNYNRSFMDSEKTRMEALTASYEEEALFPDGALTMISEPEAYKGKGVAFYGSTATFFFPDGEMSDEELLQIIDFRHKRDYSLQKMNEMVTEGEIEFPEEEIEKANEREIEATDKEILQSDAVWDPGQELTIPYTGSLEVQYMAAGENCIFLAGRDAVSKMEVIHKMEIGGSDSELFFDDFEKESLVTALYQDKKGNIYIGVLELTEDDNYDAIISGEQYKTTIWILNEEGEIEKKIDMSPYQDKMHGNISRLVVDEDGYIYVRPRWLTEGNVLLKVFDSEGNFVKDILTDIVSKFYPHPAAGLGIGKDGKVYTQVEMHEGEEEAMGIACVNLEGGCLEDVYLGIVPEDTIMLDIVSPGADTDFVFWGFDGIFTYNLGEESAVNILPAYEAPCQWEGALYCALPDGRIVFGDCTEWRTDGDEQSYYRVPDKICFYYKSGLRNP